MTPQERAMAEILHVSLFKLAEQYHTSIDNLKKRHPDKAEELDEIHSLVEKAVDEAIEDHMKNGGDFSMTTIDSIHAEISKLRSTFDGA